MKFIKKTTCMLNRVRWRNKICNFISPVFDTSKRIVIPAETTKRVDKNDNAFFRNDHEKNYRGSLYDE